MNGDRRQSTGAMSLNSEICQNRLPPSWITLNVGGECFTTTISTLKKDPKSFLARLAACQDDPEKVFLIHFFHKCIV